MTREPRPIRITMGAEQKVAEKQAERDSPDGQSRARPRSGANNGQQDGTPRRRRQSDGQLNAGRAARLGLRQIVELTGKKPEGVAAVERSEDGWSVGVEVVEDARIPSSTDVLALYQADLSERGELEGYRRIKRYKRGQGDTDYGGESW